MFLFHVGERLFDKRDFDFRKVEFQAVVRHGTFFLSNFATLNTASNVNHSEKPYESIWKAEGVE